MDEQQATTVLFIGGRSGVGKSTVTFELSRQLADISVTHALIEGDNLDHAFPPPWEDGTPVAEKNLTAVWSNYRAIGHHRLIYTNTVSVMEMGKLSDALGGTVHMIGALLQANDATAAARLSTREAGASLADHLNRSQLADLYLSESAPSSVHRISTNGRTPTDIAAELLRLTEWTTSQR